MEVYNVYPDISKTSSKREGKAMGCEEKGRKKREGEGR